MHIGTLKVFAGAVACGKRFAEHLGEQSISLGAVAVVHDVKIAVHRAFFLRKGGHYGIGHDNFQGHVCKGACAHGGMQHVACEMQLRISNGKHRAVLNECLRERIVTLGKVVHGALVFAQTQLRPSRKGAYRIVLAYGYRLDFRGVDGVERVALHQLGGVGNLRCDIGVRGTCTVVVDLGAVLDQLFPAIGAVGQASCHAAFVALEQRIALLVGIVAAASNAGAVSNFFAGIPDFPRPARLGQQEGIRHGSGIVGDGVFQVAHEQLHKPHSGGSDRQGEKQHDADHRYAGERGVYLAGNLPHGEHADAFEVQTLRFGQNCNDEPGYRPEEQEGSHDHERGSKITLDAQKVANCCVFLPRWRRGRLPLWILGKILRSSNHLNRRYSKPSLVCSLYPLPRRNNLRLFVHLTLRRGYDSRRCRAKLADIRWHSTTFDSTASGCLTARLAGSAAQKNAKCLTLSP